MLETICTPYGKAAFPTVVKCDGCGEVIEHCGWMWCHVIGEITGHRFRIVDDEKHYCDDCAEKIVGDRCEFRICDRCGSVMTEGFCDEFGDHICEECWEPFVAETFPDGFRETPEDEKEEDDDYYQAYDGKSGEWYVVSWYWTQWD